jgi:hypothetical protein
MNVNSMTKSENENTLSTSSLREQVDLINMPIETRIEKIRNMIAWHPKMFDIWKTIEECHKNAISNTEPNCMSLLGVPRSGKSTIAEQYLKKHPPYDVSEQSIQMYGHNSKTLVDITKVPILYVIIDSPPSAGSILDGLAKSLGLPPFPPKEKNNRKSDILQTMMQRCGVELIILDEIHNLLDPKSKLILAEPTEFFKTFIIQMNVPVLVIGIPDADKMYNNEQLNGRFLFRETLTPFNYNDPKDRYDFQKVLATIDSNLPLREETGLSEDGIWERILLACNGKFAYCMFLIKKSAQIALRTRYEKITLPILAQVYDSHLRALAHCKGNPFELDYRLDDALDLLGGDFVHIDKNNPATNNRMNKKRKINN